MDKDFVAIQGPQSGDEFVELARSPKGRLFRKQILPMGSFVHPGDKKSKITVDEEFAKVLCANFDAKVCDIVQAPIVDGNNKHVEDPLRNIGEVVGLTYDKTGVYATLDARKHADEIGSTILGASALMHLNYEDTKTGEKKGPTLLHMAMTNRPYITDLKEFEEVAALSADTSDEAPVAMIPATEEEKTMDKDELIAALRDEHGIDVEALEVAASAAGAQEAEQPSNDELIAALSAVIKGANPDSVALSAEPEEITVKDVADAVIELANERVELSAAVETLTTQAEESRTREAEAEVDKYIREGRILPKQREAMVALSMDDRASFDALLPDSPVVALSETGVTTYDEPLDATKREEDVNRLAEIANRATTGKKKS